MYFCTHLEAEAQPNLKTWSSLLILSRVSLPEGHHWAGDLALHYQSFAILSPPMPILASACGSVHVVYSISVVLPK